MTSTEIATSDRDRYHLPEIGLHLRNVGKMTIRVLLGALALLAVLSVPATAQQGLPFDPDIATHEWIATMGSAATARSNAYFEGGYWIQFANAGLTILICALMVVLGWARGVRSSLEKMFKLPFLVTLAVAIFFLVVSNLFSFPLDYWVGFVREHDFGLSTQTLSAWLSEYAINFAISLVISAPTIALLYAVVRVAKSSWWIWGAGFTILVFATVIMLTPVFISPFFNTYTPMPEGPQKAQILHMAQANGVPANEVYVYDASRQSHRVTANVSGLLGTTRISLADNLLTRASPEAVRMVMGHEIGHYVLHQLWSILMMLGLLIASAFAFVHFSFRALTRNGRWGIRDIGDPAGLPLAVALITFFFALATPINNSISRLHEHQADIFGLNASRAPDGFAQAALLLSEFRKVEPTPFEEWFFYDHPSGYERIHMAMVWKANEMAAGRYPIGPGGPPPDFHPDFVVTHGDSPTGAHGP